MLRVIYSFLFWLGLPLLFARLWLRGRREPGYMRNIDERFGRYEHVISRPLIWLHAVSVGEVRASASIVSALEKAYPDHVLLVTCMTAAGREAIVQVFGSKVIAAYLPYDYSFAMRRFLKHFRPCLGILIETEIWFNLLVESHRRGLPVMLANGRMSSGSAHRYARFSSITRPAFGSLAVVCAQSEADATRFAALGAHRILVAGNLKFDIEPDTALSNAGRAFKASLGSRQVLVFASTREGEERLFLDELAGRLHPGILLIIVPRHPQRFDEVGRLIEKSGMSFVRRSSGGKFDHAQVLLGDTMGEMAFYHACADVAVIGGSLLPYGGQNLIEACALGTPVVIGPHTHNFREVVELATKAGAAIQAENSGAVVESACALLEDPGRRKTMGSAGIAICAEHRGATARHMRVVRELLPG